MNLSRKQEMRIIFSHHITNMNDSKQDEYTILTEYGVTYSH